MKNLRGSTLFVVVSFVFASLLATVIIMVFLVNIALRFDLFSLSEPFQTLRTAPILLLIITSVLIGTLFSSIFGRVIITPIKELGAATKEVAKGNFNIQVKNDSLSEIGEFTRDFNKMVKDLGSIETLRSDFVTNVSHEFKTPIASIEGCAILLQDEGSVKKNGRNMPVSSLKAPTGCPFSHRTFCAYPSWKTRNSSRAVGILSGRTDPPGNPAA
jgi:signal transduction histidine kinase